MAIATKRLRRAVRSTEIIIEQVGQRSANRLLLADCLVLARSVALGARQWSLLDFGAIDRSPCA